MGPLSFLTLASLAIVGTPLFAVIALIALCAFVASGGESSSVPAEIMKLAKAPTLLTIPLFTFAGFLMAESNAPKRLIRLADAFFGQLPGGIGVVSLILCAFFTAFTGASGVTIIALGGLLYPILRSEGFSERYSLGVLTTSGSLGLLFPPSLPIILYGLVAKVDIDLLFKAGVIPGILILVILSLYSLAQGNKLKRSKSFEPQLAWEAFKGAAFEAILPLLVLTSIYAGLATPSETAALTAFYLLIVECFIYKDVSVRRDIPRIIVESMSLVGAILLILCSALGLTNYFIDQEIPYKIFSFVKEYIDNKVTFLLFLNIFLLLVGAMMDIFSAIIVVVPLIVPLAAEFQIHPIHLAIIFLANLEIGYITPPVGINLFIASIRFKKPVFELYRASLPFFVLLLICLGLITYFPQLSLFWVK